jgi:kynureninase
LPETLRRKLIAGVTGVFLTFVSLTYLLTPSAGSTSHVFRGGLSDNQTEEIIQVTKDKKVSTEKASFEKAQGLRGFQIASPSLIGLRCIKSAFSMIEEAGIGAISEKAAIGTEMMIQLFDAWLAELGFTLLTSRNPQERGGHISLGHPDAARICVALREFADVIPDYRTPNSIRLAIAPLPTSYVEVWDGFARIRDLVASRQYEKIDKTDSRVT